MVFILMFIVLIFVAFFVYIYIDFINKIKGIAFPEIFSTDYTINKALENNEFTKEFLSEEKEEFNILTNDGINLNGFIIRGNKPETIIFSHGVGWTRYGMIKYWPFFEKMGWNGIFYDQRGHGLSKKTPVSYGFNEKNDMRKIIETLSIEKKDITIVGAYGESMGAAILMQYMEIDQKLKFAICDCPFGDLGEQIRHQLNDYKLPKFYKEYFVNYANKWLKKNYGFALKDISPKKSVMNSIIPLLLVHGDQDFYVPANYSNYIYEKRKELAPTEKLIISGADHANSINVDRNKYEETIRIFLNNNFMSEDKSRLIFE